MTSAILKPRILILRVHGHYFSEMKAGIKTHEFRLQSDYWRKRIANREYDLVHVIHGYPASDATDKVLVRPWRGYEEKTITHPQFGSDPVRVFAVRINDGCAADGDSSRFS